MGGAGIHHELIAIVASRQREFGAPHAIRGEEIAAAIVLNPGSEDELQSYVREPVAAYKYSRIVGITDGLPMGATGKILKREIQIPHA